MKCLIDGDIVLYRISWACENEDEGILYARARDCVNDILNAFQTKDYEMYLSDSTENTFRYKLWDQYKANRKDVPKPKWYYQLKSYLIEQWGARITPEQEADDALGIAANNTTDSVIVSIDKDLDQIGGSHYNFVRRTFYIVEEFEGERWFYQQLLMGDTSENISGIKGIGKVKSWDIVKNCGSVEELYNDVRKEYNDDELLELNGKLLRIRREENEIWQPPTISLPEIIVT